MKDGTYKEQPPVTIEAIPQSVISHRWGGIELCTGSILTICWFCGFDVFAKETIMNEVLV